MQKPTSDSVVILEKTKQRVDALTDSLPQSIDPFSISLEAKLPYKAICFREELIWRIEELSRAACENFAQQNLAVANTLTRAVVESVAASWYLKELLENNLSVLEEDIDEKLMRLLNGHRNNSDLPQAINVMTFIDKMDKKIPGIKLNYEALCEFAHPNWSGLHGLFALIDEESKITHFGRNLSKHEYPATLGLNCLNRTLEIFEGCYNSIGDLMPAFIKACEDDLKKRKA